MATITTRAGKGSPLTNTELDNNFTNLNTAKYESGDDISVGAATTTGTLKVSTNQDDPNDSGAAYFTNKSGWGPTLHGYRFRVNAGGTGAHNNVFAVGTNMGAVFNEDGRDYDFRVESDSNASALFVNGQNSAVVVGSTTNHSAGGTAAGLTVHNGMNVDTNAGQNPLVVSRDGGENQSLTVWTDDSTASFKHTQDESTGGNFNFLRSNGTRTNTSYLSLSDTAGAIFNEHGADADFRVESDSNTHALFVDAGEESVLIGHSGPTYAELDVKGDIGIRGTSNFGTLEFYRGTGATVFARIGFDDPNASNDTFVIDSTGNGNPMGFVTNSDPFYFWTGGSTSNTADVRIEGTGGMVINENGNDSDFRVESDSNANMFFVDAGNNRVQINTGGAQSTADTFTTTGSASINGVRTIQGGSWSSWAAGTDYYLCTMNPGGNGSSAAADIHLYATGANVSASFQLVARNAGGTAYVDGRCTGTNTSSLPIIGYRDPNDAAKIHLYVRPTSSVSYTPRANVTGNGAVNFNPAAPSSAGAVNYTFYSTYLQASNLSVAGGAVFNEAGGNSDFRVESDSNAHALYLDASADGGKGYFGIRNSSPDAALEITRNSGQLKVSTESNPAVYWAMFEANHDYGASFRIKAQGGGRVHNIITWGDAYGTVFNESGTINEDFRVESNINTHMLFVDAGADEVVMRHSGSYIDRDDIKTVLKLTGSSNNEHTADTPSAGTALEFRHSWSGGNDYSVARISGRASQSYDGGLQFDVSQNTGPGQTNFNTALNILDTKQLVTYGGAIFNQDGGDNDFRVESDTRTHAFLVEGNTGNVALNRTAVPTWDSNYTVLKVGGGFGGTIASLYQGTPPYGDLTLTVNARRTSNNTVSSTGWQTVVGHSASGIVLNANSGPDIEFYTSPWTAGDGAITWDKPFRITRTEVVVNDDSQDTDFRVESNGNANMLFVDAATNRIGIGTGGPSKELDVRGSIYALSAYAANSISNGNEGQVAAFESSTFNSAAVRISGNGDSTNSGHDKFAALELVASGHASSHGRHAWIGSEGVAGSDYRTRLRFKLRGNTNTGYNFRGGSEANDILTLDGETGAAFNASSQASADFRVESDGSTHALFVDSGSTRIGINKSNPASLLHLSQGSGACLMSMQRTNGNSTGTVGGLQFLQSDGFPVSSIVAFGSASNNGSHLELRTASANSSDTNYYTGTSTRMRITSGGGIQTLHPDGVEFAVNDGSADADFRVESNNQTSMLVVDGALDAVFINGAQPTHTDVLLEITGRVNHHNIYADSPTGGYATAVLKNTATSGTRRLIDFRQGTNTTIGSITHNGTGTTYATTSDRRLKENIEPIADGTAKLMAMKPVTHTWMADPEADAVHGFIAQEMQEIVPEAVSGDPDGEEMMSMDYGRITPVLVAALQEATNEIKALKQRVSELEGK